MWCAFIEKFNDIDVKAYESNTLYARTSANPFNRYRLLFNGVPLTVCSTLIAQMITRKAGGTRFYIGKWGFRINWRYSMGCCWCSAACRYDRYRPGQLSQTNILVTMRLYGCGFHKKGFWGALLLVSHCTQTLSSSSLIWWGFVHTYLLERIVFGMG